MSSAGKLLMVAGAVLFVVGLLLTFTSALSWVGRLPGDLRIERPGFRLYLPVVTSLLLSALLTLVVYLISRFR